MKNINNKLILFYTSTVIICLINETTQRHLNCSKSSELPLILILQLHEGDICRRGNGSGPDYKCAKASDCAEGIRNDKHLDLCSLDEEYSIVCCPMTAIKMTNVSVVERPTIAEVQNANTAVEKCRQYSALRFPKGRLQYDVLRDEREAYPQEFPHMALLSYGNTTEKMSDFKCGGSLISEQWVLTAAACHQEHRGIIARWARLGDFDVNSTNDFAQPMDFRIVQHIVYPDHQQQSDLYYDIALFRLEKDVEFSAFVRPICLNTDQDLTPAELIVSGWGITEVGGTWSSVMLKVFLENVPVNQCNATYSSSLELGILPDSMICAGSKFDGVDACWGFVGSPLQTVNGESNTDTYTQFGFLSFGTSKCGFKEKPGVYTRVSKYVEWIENIVWPGN